MHIYISYIYTWPCNGAVMQVTLGTRFDTKSDMYASLFGVSSRWRKKKVPRWTWSGAVERVKVGTCFDTKSGHFLKVEKDDLCSTLISQWCIYA